MWLVYRSEADETIILIWLLQKQNERVWPGLCVLGYRRVTGCCEHGAEPSGVHKIVFYCIAEGMLAYEDGVYSVKIVILVAGLWTPLFSLRSKATFTG